PGGRPGRDVWPGAQRVGTSEPPAFGPRRRPSPREPFRTTVSGVRRARVWTAGARGRHPAMTTVETTIAAPRADVWAALVDVRTYPTWLVGARRVRSVDDGWPEPGQAFHHVVGVGPITIADATRSVAVDPERRLELLV